MKRRDRRIVRSSGTADPSFRCMHKKMKFFLSWSRAFDCVQIGQRAWLEVLNDGRSESCNLDALASGWHLSSVCPENALCFTKSIALCDSKPMKSLIEPSNVFELHQFVISASGSCLIHLVFVFTIMALSWRISGRKGTFTFRTQSNVFLENTWHKIRRT